MKQQKHKIKIYTYEQELNNFIKTLNKKTLRDIRGDQHEHKKTNIKLYALA